MEEELVNEDEKDTEIEKLKQELALYKEAFKRACWWVDCLDCGMNCRKLYNEKHNCDRCEKLGLKDEHIMDFILNEARKELEDDN